MARARTPVAKAKATAADVKNPKRHSGRRAPNGVADLGAAPMWLGRYGMKAFQSFKRELPWLKESHRVLVELASRYRGLMLDPDAVLPMQAAQELRRCLAQLGATPADESRVKLPDGDEEDEEDKLFNGSAGAGPPPPPRPSQH
jgi:hypothetical protein